MIANFKLHDLIDATHSQWHGIIEEALSAMNPAYLTQLENTVDWLPGKDALFSAFSLPLDATQYVLLGESPYPRAQSANGYAFWDAAVGEIWSPSGLSKEVNRATSLRNFIKMLLVVKGDLVDDLSQQAIQKLNKTNYVQTAEEFFSGLIKKGFLLLNASLVYSDGQVKYHAKEWKPFMTVLFRHLSEIKPSLQFILLGNIAKQLEETWSFPGLVAEHPYNLSFISNKNVQNFFKHLDLLSVND
ncbi:uracil DNA glycosylase [Legionella birminghamensis]|uniref:Uracil-DNA glycosylase n=1 Tax=Legionella birminghamensis TaxID=28083 RepID=A0A378I9B0_9GAMM|nr:uracil-DNA glycosylase family protein [Legionella birminghamensis]KTC67916.1 uracil DNA glycosylase [Legionella birminghamensis]STX31375.1 uracil-DNA glycosylase [Legionella birminghamensis]